MNVRELTVLDGYRRRKIRVEQVWRGSFYWFQIIDPEQNKALGGRPDLIAEEWAALLMLS
ncbi:hypothetical protein B2G69_07625 [Methylorubrum zatmanii]|nr:hypothetical protein B2G69_07625 [Methylorubrum zatmanii]